MKYNVYIASRNSAAVTLCATSRTRRDAESALRQLVRANRAWGQVWKRDQITGDDVAYTDGGLVAERHPRA